MKGIFIKLSFSNIEYTTINMLLKIIDYNLKKDKNHRTLLNNKIIKRTGIKSMIHEYNIKNVAFNTHTQKEKT